MKRNRAIMIGLVVLVLSMTACMDVQCAAGFGKNMSIIQHHSDNGEGLVAIIVLGILGALVIAAFTSLLGGLGGGGNRPM